MDEYLEKRKNLDKVKGLRHRAREDFCEKESNIYNLYFFFITHRRYILRYTS